MENRHVFLYLFIEVSLLYQVFYLLSKWSFATVLQNFVAKWQSWASDLGSVVRAHQTQLMHTRRTTVCCPATYDLSICQMRPDCSLTRYIITVIIASLLWRESLFYSHSPFFFIYPPCDSLKHTKTVFQPWLMSTFCSQQPPVICNINGRRLNSGAPPPPSSSQHQHHSFILPLWSCFRWSPELAGGCEWCQQNSGPPRRPITGGNFAE